MLCTGKETCAQLDSTLLAEDWHILLRLLIWEEDITDLSLLIMMSWVYFSGLRLTTGYSSIAETLSWGSRRVNFSAPFHSPFTCIKFHCYTNGTQLWLPITPNGTISPDSRRKLPHREEVFQQLNESKSKGSDQIPPLHSSTIRRVHFHKTFVDRRCIRFDK